MPVDDFCAKMQRLANEVGADDLMLRFAVINSLNPEIRNHVTRAQPNTWTDLVKQAKVGEMCVPVVQPLDTTLTVKLEVIAALGHYIGSKTGGYSGPTEATNSRKGQTT